MAYDASDVVEWGSDDQPRLAALAARLHIREHQLRVGIAGAGAVLVFLSLLVHWQATTAGVGPAPAARTRVAGLGTLGTGYVIGVLVLATLCTMTLFGHPGLRTQLRIATLGWAGALLGLLLATAVLLGTTSSVLGELSAVGGPTYTVAYEPGVFLAVGGVVLLALSAYLTDRTRPTPVPAEEPDTAPADLEVKPAKPFVYPGSVDPRD